MDDGHQASITKSAWMPQSFMTILPTAYEWCKLITTVYGWPTPEPVCKDEWRNLLS